MEDENKTIGVVLYQNQSESVVEYTLPENNEHTLDLAGNMLLLAKKYLPNAM